MFSIRMWHDDVIKWRHFPRYWPFVRGIHRSPVNSPHKGQWRGAWMFSLICVWINGWVNNRKAGDLRRYRVNYDVIVMGCTDVYLLEFHGHEHRCLECKVFPYTILVGLCVKSASCKTSLHIQRYIVVEKYICLKRKFSQISLKRSVGKTRHRFWWWLGAM